MGRTLLIHKKLVLHTKHEKWKAECFQEHYPNLTIEEEILLIRTVETDWLGVQEGLEKSTEKGRRTDKMLYDREPISACFLLTLKSMRMECSLSTFCLFNLMICSRYDKLVKEEWVFTEKIRDVFKTGIADLKDVLKRRINDNFQNIELNPL